MNTAMISTVDVAVVSAVSTNDSNVEISNLFCLKLETVYYFKEIDSLIKQSQSNTLFSCLDWLFVWKD